MSEQYDPYIGREILGQYLIEKKLGEGGMGVVFLADQPAMARKAAIKILRPEVASVEQMERFQREAQTLSNIDHPHIIKVYNFGTLDDGELYIAMEFVQGKEMDKVLEDEGRMPWERAVRVIIQAADALVEAHSKGIIHRDLKPENIMLCERRESADYVKVMDFGIARVLENNEDLESSATVAGIIHGTPMYMSPEQARGEPVDARSDIYSLGIVFYAMLTCELPIKSNTLVGFIIAHQSEPPEPLANYGVIIPRRLEDILFRMLEKKVEDRYQSMQEVLNELRALIAPPPVKTNKKLVVVLLLLIVLLIGGGAVAVLLLGLFHKETAKVVTAGLPPGVIEASDNKQPDWIKRQPPTTDKTFVLGKGVASLKVQARAAAEAVAAAKLLERGAATQLHGDDEDTQALKAWLKAVERLKPTPAQEKLVAEALAKSSLGFKLKDSQDYWELNRPPSGGSQYFYWSLFAYPVEELRAVMQKAREAETAFGMRAIPLYPLLAPLVEESDGVLLSKVKDGSAAARAEVLDRDIVVRLGGQLVKNPKDFVAKLKLAAASLRKGGEPLTLDLVRLEGGAAKKVSVELVKLK